MALARDDLVRLNLDDLMASLGCGRLVSHLLRHVLGRTARAFADHMAAFDEAVGHSGELLAPARALLTDRYVRGLRSGGAQHVPARGAALFLANHPGMTDTLSLIAAIGRPDLKIIAARRPFLEALPNAAQHMIFIDANLGRRVLAAHAAAAHVKSGGAVLTFPAGCIEPDPDVAPGAAQSLEAWADSARFVTQLAPETVIVPTLVRGVIWRKTAHHWLTRLQRCPADREKRAAALQLMAMIAFNLKPTAVAVHFSAPLRGPVERGGIARQMRQLMAESGPRSGSPAEALAAWSRAPQFTAG